MITSPKKINQDKRFLAWVQFKRMNIDLKIVFNDLKHLLYFYFLELFLNLLRIRSVVLLSYVTALGVFPAIAITMLMLTHTNHMRRWIINRISWKMIVELNRIYYIHREHWKKNLTTIRSSDMNRKYVLAIPVQCPLSYSQSSCWQIWFNFVLVTKVKSSFISLLDWLDPSLLS